MSGKWGGMGESAISLSWGSDITSGASGVHLSKNDNGIKKF